MFSPLSRMFILVSPRIKRSFSIRLKSLSPLGEQSMKRLSVGGLYTMAIEIGFVFGTNRSKEIFSISSDT